MEKAAHYGLEGMIGRAASLHGHTCPSLVYGCRLALLLAGLLPAGRTPDRVVVRHSSACLLDGVSSVLGELFPSLRPISERGAGGCSLEATWPEGRVAVTVRPGVRELVDRIKKTHPELEDFRRSGVAYLLSLTEDEFATLLP